jgi:hypothetical protein
VETPRPRRLASDPARSRTHREPTIAQQRFDPRPPTSARHCGTKVAPRLLARRAIPPRLREHSSPAQDAPTGAPSLGCVVELDCAHPLSALGEHHVRGTQLRGKRQGQLDRFGPSARKKCKGRVARRARPESRGLDGGAAHRAGLAAARITNSGSCTAAPRTGASRTGAPRPACQTRPRSVVRRASSRQVPPGAR